MLRIIKHHNPKVLFLENVPNLLEVDNGNHWNCIKSHIEDSGYVVHYKVINAKTFVP